MNNKSLIFFITLLCALICISPIMAADNSAFIDYALFDFNVFGGESDSITVTDLIIEKIKTEHTDSEGKTDKHNDFFVKFNVQNDDSMGNYSLNIICKDKNNRTFKNVESYVDKTGEISIPVGSYVANVNVTIKDGNGNILYQNSTSKIKVTENITKDKPVEEKTETTSTSSSSSSSSQTYWGSSNSGKFHYPSCEWGQKISSKNKVVFHSRDEAINSGYQPCQVCSP